MSAADDRSLGELGRGFDALATKIDALGTKIDGLSTTYTPREVHDLAIGGMKIDLRRLDEEREKTELKVVGLESEINRRFRQGVTITFTSVLAPGTLAAIFFVLDKATR